MIWLLALSLLVNAFTVFIAVRNIRELNQDGIRERELLLNRIQAPQMAVAMTMPDPEGKGFIEVDDDESLNRHLRDLDGADSTR